ncbi:tyrosine-type recombinase/integrase [Aureimonas sp. Leaf454]|uniref:tyrosine-type recombinase/integrase n=1 Tax=Aureimonas sp. Leaf454 TaxID=1736381 RepID=UPI000B09E448|nr:tyrosine-type recombinase/integrase [Aureimonas sp. Leaf454]
MMSFLAESNVVLSADDQAALLDDVQPDFIAALKLLRTRSQGNYREDTYSKRFPTKTSSRTRLAGLTVWKLFEMWVRETKPKGSTVTRWRAVFQNLDDTFAGKDVAEITADDAVEWKSTLVTEKRTVRTANVVWLGATSSVFGWARQERKIAVNPFEGLSFSRVKVRPVVRDREFTEEEWRTLLNAALDSEPGRRKPGLAAAVRWLPWLCAYTGARSGEIAQLRGQDVQQHRDGFWTITITPDAGTVKTDKARTLPLHEHLVELGFPAFAKGRGPGPLFYDASIVRKAASEDVTKPVAPPAQMVRQRISEWVRKVGVTDQDVNPNHAWRHTFKRRAARAGLEPRIRDGMCGHSVRDVASHYETASVEDFAEAMKQFPRYDLSRP